MNIFFLSILHLITWREKTLSRFYCSIYGSRYSTMDQVKFFKVSFPLILLGLIKENSKYLYDRLVTWKNAVIIITAVIILFITLM